jgi:hypothetical protein
MNRVLARGALVKVLGKPDSVSITADQMSDSSIEAGRF